jgi:hypothetical protein
VVTTVQGTIAGETPEVAPEPRNNGTLPDRPSTDPVSLSDELNRAEEILNDGSSTASEIESAGRLQQLGFRSLVTFPEREEPVLARLSTDTRQAADAFLTAAKALTAIVEPQQKLPDWRIVKPATPQRLLALYRHAESVFGVPWQYLAAIQLVETRMGRIRGDSTAGAQGPMQFIPGTWARYGSGDINSNRDSIMAAARLLVANGAPSDMARAIYRYNPSDEYVIAIQSYANHMIADERAFLGYYHWQVLYKHVSGTLLLPVGYPSAKPEPID